MTWTTRVLAVCLVLACFGVFAPSLSAPFVFDDKPAVVDNPTIRRLWPPWQALSPPGAAAGAGGRPLVNLSLAINYALGALDPRGYHVVNVGLHALASLVLFGLLRRTFEQPLLVARFGRAAAWLGGCISILWAVHPLQTESVICVVQRSELLGGLFYLLTVYGFARSIGTASPVRWRFLAVVACTMGVASKELVASAPLVVLLYDRTLISGTFREAWSRHSRMYLGFAGAWILLACLIVGANQRGDTVGFGLGVSSWHYLLTQCQAIGIYLRLSFWPDPLVVDYGSDLVKSWRSVWPQAFVLSAGAIGMFWTIGRRSVWGLLGFWFFAILAPSSSVVPLTTQTIAEHRMYLPLVVIVTVVVVGVFACIRQISLVVALCVFTTGALAGGSIRRNADYQSEFAFWTDTVAKRPSNARAHFNLGNVLARAGEYSEAIGSYRKAVLLRPDYAQAHNNLASALVVQGSRNDAIAHYEASLQSRPDHAGTRFNLGLQLWQAGRASAAVAHLRMADALNPNISKQIFFLAQGLLQTGDLREAVHHFERISTIDPDYPGLQSALREAKATLQQSQAVGQRENAEATAVAR